MRFKDLLAATAALSTLCLVTSCGDSSLGSGVGEGKTVNVTAQAADSYKEFDVITGNTCSTTGSTGGTIATEFVNVDVASAQQISTGKALDVRVNSATISYTPASSTSPPIQNQYVAIGTTLPAGGSISIPIPVALREVKLDLMNKGLLPCSTTIYKYHVTVSFEAVEIGTGSTMYPTANMTASFADVSG
ncbi:hypothetical protein OR1_00109 [Geobacter sp. OR-1]|uniref:hypothetical protein n=1 Tax=Geobacter sp. OR-1 TaxID=1266765 RepID=UPI000542EBF9|nr:hypothetical protein [Geobacter sp. OR-1]GAM07840.1 hypothetical protein OR1_00109 [Geobacter sp. OR-1]